MTTNTTLTLRGLACFLATGGATRLHVAPTRAVPTTQPAT